MNFYLDPLIACRFLSFIEKRKIDISALSFDRIAGIHYALSSLPESSQQWIRLRFSENYSANETAETLGLTFAEETSLEKDTLHKLRHTCRWDWICYGIEGNLDRRLAQANADSFLRGYYQGLRESGISISTPQVATPIEGLALSRRIHKILERAEITTLAQLTTLDEYGILKIRGLGKESAYQIAAALHKMNLYGTAWDCFSQGCSLRE